MKFLLKPFKMNVMKRIIFQIKKKKNYFKHVYASLCKMNKQCFINCLVVLDLGAPV